MKSFQPPRFFNLLLIVALLVLSVVWLKDLFVAVLLSAFQLNDYLVPLIMKRSTRRRGWILWACAACALAGAYYLVDVFLMPVHSPFHSREIIYLTLLSMSCGLAATYYALRARAKAVN